MGYRDRVLSVEADIDDSLAESSEASSIAEQEYALQIAAEKAEDMEAAEIRISATIDGINWQTNERMSLPEWKEHLDIIDATPEQRRLYEEAVQEEANSRHEFIEDYTDHYDRYPFGFNPGND